MCVLISLILMDCRSFGCLPSKEKCQPLHHLAKAGIFFVIPPVEAYPTPMSQQTKKKFHKFTACLAQQEREGDEIVTKYISGLEDSELEMSIDLDRITLFHPQTIHSGVVPGAHALGSKIFLVGVHGIGFLVVKESFAEIEEIMRR